MSEDDFGTVNIRRGDRAREIEILRQQYKRHREALSSLGSDAPTEHLAGEYARMIRDIDQALRKLDELEGSGGVPADTQPLMRPDTAPRRSTAAGTAAAAAGAASGAASDEAFRRRPTEAGGRRLVTGPAIEEPVEARPGSASRLVLIVFAGLVVLGIIGWLLWRASGERKEEKIVRETDTVAATAPDTVVPVSPVPQAPPEVLTITPPAQDYGAIRKGTRAVRQFQVTNTSKEPMTVQVARSQCRCLYYDYVDKLAPGKKETITVTIDGAKAKSGPLHETLTVASKTDPTISATFDINADIK